MSLKSSNRARQLPAHAKLAAAIARCQGRSAPEQHANLLERLMAAPLLVAIEGLPEGFAFGAEGETPVRFLSEERAEGERVVFGFSSPEALAAKAPAAVGLLVDPATVLDWIIAGGVEGLVLDPAGPSAFVSHDDARQLLGLPRRAGGGRRAGALSENERVLQDGLAGLVEEEAEHQQAVVREASTAKALQFDRVEGGALRMVLDAATLAGDERARAEVLFEEFAGGADDLPPLEDGEDTAPASEFVALFSGDLERPTRAALKVFTWVFGFPPGFALEVELGKDQSLAAGASMPSSP